MPWKGRLFIGGIVLSIFLGIFSYPLPDELTNPKNISPLHLLDRNGKHLYSIRHSDFGSQEFLSFDSIQTQVVEVLLTVEDRTFFSHFGVSIRGVIRAAFLNISSGRIVSGGSTITQQLVRNRLQPSSRGYRYKLKEMYFAWRLERYMTKEEILESYLNTAYFGHQSYGIGAAASTYFGKSVSELSVSEISLLVGLLQSPSVFDPFVDIEAARGRQKVVLNSLYESNILSSEVLSDALREPLSLVSDRTRMYAPHFVSWLVQNSPEFSEISGEKKTTLERDLQLEIERIIEQELSRLQGKHVTSAAVVVLDAHTGELLSMVGSADYWNKEHDGQVNVATSLRQPGSALKPFTYALALESGDTAATTVYDIETSFFTQEGNPYIPRNYDYGYHGLVRYREALANSYNIAAVRVLEKFGVQNLLKLLQSAGITTLHQSPEYYGLALTLGDGEVTLLELVQAYGIFARKGKTLPLKVFLDEETKEGRQIIGTQTAWLIADILSDHTARLPEFGADSVLNFDFPVAAKTGTTRNSRDNWTVGFSSDRIVGVWVGNADNSSMRGTSGVTGAGPIFHQVMLAATKGFLPHSFQKPLGIQSIEICRLSGKLPTKYCPHTINEFFASGTQPKTFDDIFQPFQIDTRNNLLAIDGHESFIEEKIFAVFPGELQKWARENGWELPPRTYSPLTSSVLTITKPHANDSFQLDPLIPDENEKIIFEARASKNITTVEWWVDGVSLGTRTAPDFRFEWKPLVGNHEIVVKSHDAEANVFIEVKE